MTNTIDDVTDKQIMDCMLGFSKSLGYIKMPNNDYMYCTLLKTPEPKIDCCYKGKLIMQLKDVSTNEITNYYQCRRTELNAK